MIASVTNPRLAAGLLVGSALSLALAVLLTPVVRSLARRTDFVDRPSGHKTHREPVPLLGGIGVYLAFLVALLVAQPSALTSRWPLLAGATLVALLGLLDDRRALGAGFKLLAQVVACTLLVAGGTVVRLPLPGWLDLALTYLWVVGITNAFNLLDNLDGLSSGVAAITSAWIAALAVSSGDLSLALAALCLTGACVGFVSHNVSSRRIFLGDSGSLFIGFVIAVLGLELAFPDNVPWITWMVPVVLLGLPIFDTTLVVISRLRRGMNPLSSPGRDHVSHRLIARGASPRSAMLIAWAASLALGTVAFGISRAALVPAYALGGSTLLAGAAALWWLESGSDTASEESS